jgi:dimethylargininase
MRTFEAFESCSHILGRLIAITHLPSPKMNAAVRTFIDVEPIDFALALRQHEAYRDALSRAGAEVIVLEVNASLADAVFIEDTAVMLPEVAILTSMGTPTRRDEVAGIESELRRRGLAKDFERLAEPATIEGGDVLRVGRTLYVGATRRTNEAGFDAFARIVRAHGYEAQRIPVNGCLHLKTGCTALPGGTMLVNPRWVDVNMPCLAVAEDEPMAANVVLAGERVIMAAAHPRTIELVRSRGFEVDAVDLSEFGKAEGASTCLSLILR